MSEITGKIIFIRVKFFVYLRWWRRWMLYVFFWNFFAHIWRNKLTFEWCKLYVNEHNMYKIKVVLFFYVVFLRRFFFEIFSHRSQDVIYRNTNNNRTRSSHRTINSSIVFMNYHKSGIYFEWMTTDCVQSNAQFFFHSTQIVSHWSFDKYKTPSKTKRKVEKMSFFENQSAVLFEYSLLVDLNLWYSWSRVVFWRPVCLVAWILRRMPDLHLERNENKSHFA